MFHKATFDFLDELTTHNERAWFEANKPRYESLVREPALEFIAAMAPALQAFAPHFRAEARKMGGSLMRVHRDTRFSRNKTPYKTNIGIQFRHELARDVHAPGFYLHIALDGCFFGVGCWHPEAEALGKIRALIAEKPQKWLDVRNDKEFSAHWNLVGDRLKRPPRGYNADHPVIEDIKRRDFVADAPLFFNDVISPALVRQAEQRFAETVPFMGFLCEALGVPY